jgi:hypothetical protein
MVLQGYKDSPSDFFQTLSVSGRDYHNVTIMHIMIHSQPSGFVGLEPQEMRSHDGHAYRIIVNDISFQGSRSKKKRREKQSIHKLLLLSRDRRTKYQHE